MNEPTDIPNSLVFETEINGTSSHLLEVPLAQNFLHSNFDVIFNWFESQTGSKIKLTIGNKDFVVTKFVEPKPWRIDPSIELYRQLTKKEKSILVFLSKGYKQARISVILMMPINTYRDIRKKLYKKMGFRMKYDLINWCNVNLNDCIDLKEFNN